MLMHSQPAISFRNTDPLLADAALVMSWRNDPVTLAMSYHQKPKSMPGFLEEFRADYFIYPDYPPLFAMLNGEEVAFLRVKPYELAGFEGPTVSIDVNLAPAHRGQGLGAMVLERVCRRIFSQGVEMTVAEVKRGNAASLRAFEKAGFCFLDEQEHLVEDTGERVPIFRLMRRKSSLTPDAVASVFIIAEAGSNFRMGTPPRDLAMAKALIDVAAEAGADAVKFQTYRPETVYVPNAGEADYLSEAGVKESITDIFRDLSMPYDMIPKLAEYCRTRDIEFMSTPFSVADAEAVDPFVARHKLASYEISHRRLIEGLAATGKPLIMSTGAAEEADIEWAVDLFFQSGGKDLTLLQCTAKYPAPLTSLNLRAIPWLRERFGVLAGLSDHSRDPIIGPAGAVALGATVIEKHFTLHNKLPGPDHSFALTPDDLKTMVNAIRSMEQAVSQEGKTILEDEQELRSFARRSVQAVQDIKKGEPIQEGVNVDVLRPGKQRQGAHPKFLDAMEGKPTVRDIPAGDGVSPGDWTDA
jgi:N-acetylneuraminate synthase